ncbi:hypothetical protein BH10ACT3_BH10ACT3_10420 [soil metagenome]
MQTTRRITGAAVLIAGLALFAGACGSSDSDAETTTTKKETTTTASDSSDSSDGTDDSTEDTVSDEDFDAAVDEVSGQLDETGGDICGVLEVMGGSGSNELPTPSTKAQVKTAVALLDQLFGAIADAAPAEYASEADTIRTAMTGFDETAKEKDYDPEWFNSDEADPFKDEAASNAMNNFYDTASEACAPATETTVAP